MAKPSNDVLEAFTALEGNKHFETILDWVRDRHDVADPDSDAAGTAEDRILRFRLGQRAAFREILDGASSPGRQLNRRQASAKRADGESKAFG